MAGVRHSWIGEQMIRVFLSYSRKDGDFCQRLATALEARDCECLFDTSDIAREDPNLILLAQDEWWLQVQRMIAASDVMVFVVSPDSAASRACDDEIAHAKLLGKRVIPVRYRDIDYDRAPVRLRALNHNLDFRDADEARFQETLERLLTELQFEAGWHRTGAHYARLATKWDQDKRPGKDLLRWEAVIEADAWIAGKPAAGAEIGELVREYIETSRSQELVDIDDRRRLVGSAFVVPARMESKRKNFDGSLRNSAAGMALSDDLASTLVPERAVEIIAAGVANAVVAVLRTDEAARVGAMAFLSDGVTLAVGRENGELEIWNPEGAVIAARSGGRDPIRRVRPILEGADYVSASGVVARVLAPAYGEEIVSSGGSGGTRDFCVARNMTAEYHARFACLMDTKTGEKTQHFVHEEEYVTALALSDDGALLATGTEEGTVTLFDTLTGKELRYFLQSASINALAFSADGALIASADDGGRVHVYAVHGEGPHMSIGGGAGTMLAVAFDPSGVLLATAAADGSVRVWDWARDALVHEFGASVHYFNGLAFNARSTLLAAASDRGDVWVWDLTDTATPRHLWLPPTNRNAYSVATSYGRGLAVACSEYQNVHVVDLTTHALVRTFKAAKEAVLDAAFRPDGRHLATCGQEGSVKIWDAQTWRQVGVFMLGERIECVAYDATGGLIAAGNIVGEIILIDPTAERVISRHRVHSGSVRRVCFSPDNDRVLSGGFDGAVKLSRSSALDQNVDVCSGLRRILDVAFSRTGRDIGVAVSDGVVGIVDAVSGRERLKLVGHEGGAATLAFSADGKRIVTGSEAGMLYVWDAEHGLRMQSIPAHARAVTRVTVSPDGLSATTVSMEGDLKTWDLSRSAASASPFHVALAAQLARGAGAPAHVEAMDVVMRMAPERLFEWIEERLSEEEREDLNHRKELRGRRLQAGSHDGA